MDVFKLGIVNAFGITLPGSVVLLSFCYMITSGTYIMEGDLHFYDPVLNSQFLSTVVFFVMSYVIGSILRVESAETLDELSSKYLEKRFWTDYASNKRKENEEVWLDNMKNSIIDGKIGPFYEAPLDQDKKTRQNLFDTWIWRVDRFPYTVWFFRQLQLYYPNEVFIFFKNMAPQMGMGSWPYSKPPGRGLEFFNFCKNTVCSKTNKATSFVVEEIYTAEALVRFYSGTYVAARLARFFILLILLIYGLVIVFVISNRFEYCLELRAYAQGLANIKAHAGLIAINAIASVLLLKGLWSIEKRIVAVFRKMRLKEVNTVYTSYYFAARASDISSGKSPL